MISITLKNLRKQKGWKQEYVARKIYVTRVSYSYYETGRVVPSFEVLIRLADLFEISLDEFRQCA
jgi:transcriptional regulator with XRE-family HTH domain